MKKLVQFVILSLLIFSNVIAETRNNELKNLFSIKPTDPQEKIQTVKEIYVNSGAAEETRKEINNFTQRAFKVLEEIEVPQDKKRIIQEFGTRLMNREV